MNARQLSVARHALGLPNDEHVSYRNRYLLPTDSQNYPEWVAMKDEGLAIIRAISIDNCICFSMTLKGAQLALGPSERLGEEDFPEMRVRV